MSLTITIPGAVNVTTGSFAPAVLTIGVGVPGAQGPQGQAGQGVPAGGSAGQFLQKIDGVSYNTDWVTVNLGAYAVKANNLSDLTSASTARTNLGLGTMATATAADYSTTTAANGLYYPLTGNPSSFLTASALTGYATQSFVAANYAPIAAGLPTGGTVGQVLTKNSGTNFDVSFQTLIPGDRYLTTSSTSNTIGNGAKTFTVGTGLSYSSQQDVVISYDASNHMHALVTSYNSGTGVLVVDVNHHIGSGTYTAWTINVGGMVPLQSVEWGEILGTIGDQSDLATALGNKLETSTAASTYAALAGATFTGEVVTPASTTSNAGLMITPGVAPTTPSNGEIWATTNDLQVRLNGVTETVAEQSWVTGQGYITASALTPYAPLAGSTFTGLISTLAPTTATAGLRLPHGTAPTTGLTNGDLWTTTSGIFARINGTTRQYVDLDGTQTISGNKTFSNATLTLGNSTGAGTISIGTGATVSGSTRTINIGTASAAGSTNAINIGGGSGTTTTTLQGTTNGVTVAADTNSTALATTAFVVGQAGSATPLVNGTAAVGTSLRFARQDHVHPTDTSRAPTASPTFTGIVTIPAGASIVGYATESFVTSQGYITSSALTGYATESFVTSQGYLTDAPSDGNQYARKDGAWDIVSGGGSSYITSVTSPLSVTSGNLSVDLSNYLTLGDAATAYLSIYDASVTYYPLTNPDNFMTESLATAIFAPKSSPSLTGTPLSTTAAADTNTTQIATTAFVVGQAGSATPLVNGTAAVGTSLRYARQDHVHPSDTSRAALSGATFTGKVNTVAPTTAAASINLPHGTAPTAPVDGDLWSESDAFRCRINGVAQVLLTSAASIPITGFNTFTNANQTLGNSSATGTINVGSGATISGSTKTVNIGTGGVTGSTTTINIGSVAGSTGTIAFNGTPTFTAASGTFCSGTATGTVGFATAATLSGNTKTVNLGTGGVAGSTTNITIGSANASTTTVNGRLVSSASTTTAAGFRITQGSAPTTPADGDVWATTSGVFSRTASSTAAMSAFRAYALAGVTGGAPSLTAGFNVSSITDNGVGDFTMNFNGALPSASYLVIGSVSANAGADGSVVVTTRATGNCRISTIWNGALADVANFSVAFIV